MNGIWGQIHFPLILGQPPWKFTRSILSTRDHRSDQQWPGLFNLSPKPLLIGITWQLVWESGDKQIAGLLSGTEAGREREWTHVQQRGFPRCFSCSCPYLLLTFKPDGNWWRGEVWEWDSERSNWLKPYTWEVQSQNPNNGFQRSSLSGHQMGGWKALW